MKKNEIYYDAFISYRHKELDTYVAENLHKMLERYRIPKRIQESSGKKKISRIFRDREELPTSSDLAENIQTALEHSEYLIVICSPEAVQSEWVQKEIRVFLETHSKANVLTVLAKGEPEDAFPEILCYDDKIILTEDGQEKRVRQMVEPLAADVRGANKAEVQKKLKQEVLRILAPMLGCSYDDLRQRHKEYRMRQMLAAAGVCTGLAFAFTCYALYQNTKIQEQYNQALINESQYLIELSGQLLAEGDREGALEKALEAAPSEEEDRPLIPEVMYALNSALYSYANEGRIYFRADKLIKTDSQTMTHGQFSEDGAYYLSMDESGIVYFHDGKTGELVWKLRASQVDEILDTRFERAYFATSEKAVLVGERFMLFVNPKTQTIEQVIQTDLMMDDYDGLYACGTHVLLDHYTGCSIYDLESGELVLTKEYDELNLAYNAITGAAWLELPSADGTENELVVALGSAKRWTSTETQGILLLSVTTGETRWIDTDEVAQICALEDGRLATIEYVKEDFYDDERWCYVRIYDAESGRRTWNSEGVYSYQTKFYSGLASYVMDAYDADEKNTVLAANINDTLLLIEADRLDEFARVHFSSPVMGIGKYDVDRLIVGLADGTIQIQTMENATFPQNSGKIDNEITYFAYDTTTQSALQLVDGSNKTVLSRMYVDESMTQLELEGTTSSIAYITWVPFEDSGESAVKGYRLVIDTVSLGDGSEQKTLLLYDLDTGEQVINTGLDGSYIKSMSAFESDGKMYFSYAVTDSSYDVKMHTVDLESGEDVYAASSAEENAWLQTGDDVAYSNSGKWIVHYNGYDFGIVDALSGEELLPYEEHMGDGVIVNAWGLPDDQYILFSVKSYSDGGYLLKLWSVEEQKVVTTFFEGNGLADLNYLNNMSVGKKNDWLAIYMEDEVQIIDLVTGEILQRIPMEGAAYCRTAFISNDKYLLLLNDTHELMMWNMEKQEITMTEYAYFAGSVDFASDSNGEYFAIKDQILLSDDGVTYQPLYIYTIDEEKDAFYSYAKVNKGLVCFEKDEVCCLDLYGNYYYGAMKTFEELREQAENVLE